MAPHGVLRDSTMAGSLKGEFVAKLECFSVEVANKPGRGVELLEAFRKAGVNFVGIWGYPVGKKKTRIDLVPEDPGLLKESAKKLKIALGKKQTTFHVTGADHPGAVAETLAKLAEKGINVHAVQALCGGNGSYGAMIEVDPDDVKKAAKALA